jgi:hypothetical protein
VKSMASSDKDTKPSQAGSPVFDGNESDLLLAEYNTLRTELLQRVSTSHQLISLTLTVFGTFLGFVAFNSKSIYFVLLYPVLAFFMSNVYFSNILIIERITDYVKTIEKYVSENSASGIGKIFGWQTFSDEKYEPKQGQPRPLGTRIIFPLTGTLALAFGFLLFFLETGLNPGVTSVLIGLAALSCGFTWILFFRETPFFSEMDRPPN